MNTSAKGAEIYVKATKEEWHALLYLSACHTVTIFNRDWSGGKEYPEDAPAASAVQTCNDLTKRLSKVVK